MSSAAVVTTLSGTGVQGNKDGYIDTATFTYPWGVAMDSQGNLFVICRSTIRKITPNGIVSTFAGDPNGLYGHIDATGTSALFYSLYVITIDESDNIFVADVPAGGGAMIRKITPTGVVTTFAGNSSVGSADGNGSAASFNDPYGLVTDPNGNLFVCDYGNNNIRKITPAGDVTTFAGNGAPVSADGPALSASFNGPIGIARDSHGNFYVVDATSSRIRMITSDGIVVTLAGNDQTGIVDGVGQYAGFFGPTGIAIGPDGVIYVLDSYYSFIRKMIVQ
jgi:sugar lactone lactonase YvrE